MTHTEKLAWEKQAYGMTAAEVDQMVKQQAFPGTEMMFAAGLISDAQHVIDAEFNEDGWVSPQRANQARQYMNIAKKIMFDMMNNSEERKAA
jgi:hypothetical protein